jgi:rhodanese-related sulfurtransferase
MQLVGDGWIPGARFVTTDQVDSIVSEIDPQKNIVLYCACPNEVTAAKVAKAFISKGYVNVRPLTGGIDAWIAAGHEVEKIGK